MITTTIALASVLVFQQAAPIDNNGLASTPVETSSTKDSAVPHHLELKAVKPQVAEVTKNEVSVRVAASASASVLVTVSKGATAKVLGFDGDWVRLSFSNGTSGYVHKALVKLSDSKVGDIVPKRSDSPQATAPQEPGLPDTPDRANGDVDHAHRLVITINSGEASIRRPDAEPVREPVQQDPQPLSRPIQHEVSKPAEKVDNSVMPNSPFAAKTSEKMTASAEQVLKSAAGLLGSPYVWGATGSRGAYDCSGFTGFIFRQNGISLPRTAMEQFGRGSAVDKNSLQPGDLVFFSSRSSRVGHVGIYVGDGKFIHCSSGAGHVTYSELSATYYASHYVGARRVLSGGAKLSTNPVPLPISITEDSGEKL